MIILYTQTGCPQCRMVHMLCDKYKIEYKEVQNVEEMKSKGINHTPVIEFNGKLLSGKDMMTFINSYRKIVLQSL